MTIGNASEDIDFVIEDWIPNTLSVGDILENQLSRQGKINIT